MQDSLLKANDKVIFELGKFFAALLANGPFAASSLQFRYTSAPEYDTKSNRYHPRKLVGLCDKKKP
jgi:hypothetical protein